MRSIRISWLISALLFVFLLLTTRGVVRAQDKQPMPPPPPTGPPANAAPHAEVDEIQARMLREAAKKANLQRQALIKADTDRLLRLATELKESVDKSTENVLSLDVVKKADEIEKLAHTVKDKMKGPT